MSGGKVVAIFISPEAEAPMQEVEEVMAIAGLGLEGDRYCKVQGSFSMAIRGKRQVALMHARHFVGTDFAFEESRRNLIVDGEYLELMGLIGEEFQIGEAVFRGVKYCTPCNKPSRLVNKPQKFKKQFRDHGGLIAEVLSGGKIRVGSLVIPPPKYYE